MRFHAAILIPNGEVWAKVCRDGAMMARDGVNRKFMDEFKRLLRENLTDDPTRCGKFRAKVGRNLWDHPSLCLPQTAYQPKVATRAPVNRLSRGRSLYILRVAGARLIR